MMVIKIVVGLSCGNIISAEVNMHGIEDTYIFMRLPGKFLGHLDQEESEHTDGENRSQLCASREIKD